MEKQKTNTFAELDASAQPTKKEEIAVSASKEISFDDFSDTAVGEKVKYNRPDLNGKEDVVDKFAVFMPDTSEEPKLSMSGKVRYWKPNIILTYASKNAEGVQNREYISGAKVFQNKDGRPSDIQFWYPAGVTEGETGNQSCLLWQRVATALKKAPEDMSPREFVSFLNMKPKVLIEGREYKNYNAPAGSPRTVKKNLPKEFKQ